MAEQRNTPTMNPDGQKPALQMEVRNRRLQVSISINLPRTMFPTVTLCLIFVTHIATILWAR
ncbi:hypothetical protein ACI2LC_12465 [Nonomuraea wenchangensis]|uniref:hypothetical protein n=1 Tax=Nonomuraea wenchangensis TaxID=568860 RepID=UPI00384C0AD7